jgi:hypothetical protein
VKYPVINYYFDVKLNKNDTNHNIYINIKILEYNYYYRCILKYLLGWKMFTVMLMNNRIRSLDEQKKEKYLKEKYQSYNRSDNSLVVKRLSFDNVPASSPDLSIQLLDEQNKEKYLKEKCLKEEYLKDVYDQQIKSLVVKRLSFEEVPLMKSPP